MYTTRPYNPETDKAFVYSTWLRGLFYANDFYNQIERSAFFGNYPKVLDSIISKSAINIACDSEDNDVILAYVVLQNETLHYCYTKAAWRLKGLQKALLSVNPPKYCTHITPIGNDMRLARNIVFNPFLI